MAGVKRKRNANDAAVTPNQADEVPNMPKYTTGKALRDAIQLGSKDHLRAAEYQIRVPQSTQPVAITHPTILLIQNYLALSPTLDEVYSAWRKGHERKDQDIEASAVHLLASIIHSLTPIPYFQTILEGLAEKVLETGGPWAGWLNSLISSSTRDLALPGLSLASALLNISTLSTTLSLGFGTIPPATTASASRLNTKIWQSLIEGGSLRSLPKLLSMRRKGGFAIGADPLDKPDIRHNALNLLLPLLSNPTFLSGCKPLLPSIFSNLTSDPPITIVRVLSSIWSAINSSPIPAINRKTASTLLTEQSIEGIVKLYTRDGTGPDDIVKGIASSVASKSGDTTVSEIAHAFLMGVCTRPGVGICFPDNGWYRRKGKERLGGTGNTAGGDEEEEDIVGANGAGDGMGLGGSFVHNRTLNNVVRKIGPRVSEDSKVAILVEGILGACPELVASYWPYSGVSLDPKLSAKWIATISFIGRVIASPLPDESTFRIKDGTHRRSAQGKSGPPKIIAPPLQALVEAILPSPLSKHHLSKGLQGSIGLIQHLCALTLARALQKLGQVQALMLRMGKELEGEMTDSKGDNSWFARVRELELEMRKRVPDVPVIVTFAQRSAASQALQASLEDGEQNAKAKAELLTESALRLFQLYYETLPAMSSELHFDVGKLLVSSANAKQEAAFRKNSREDSVFSETGSIASMGTIGTIGMGGGFGQARGDVEGFDTLSQMHVLELLANVREWNWTSKASGSTHSYLFHVLQLYLSTPHLGTKARTKDLLQDMIGASILFEHDPLELDLWLQALPGTRDPSVPAPAALVLHQTNLLDFVDDCARRCMKTPFRYAELASQIPGLSGTISSHSRPSLLLFAVLEQLEAKVGGHHISTDSALAVILYVKLLVMLFLEKGLSSALCVDLMLRQVSVIQAAAEKRGDALAELVEAATSAAHQIKVVGDPGLDFKPLAQPSTAFRFDGLDEVELIRWSILRDGGSSRTLNELLSVGPSENASVLAGVPFAAVVGIPAGPQAEAREVTRRIALGLLRQSPANRLPGYARILMRQLHQAGFQSSGVGVLLNVLDQSGNGASVRDVHDIVFGSETLPALIISAIDPIVQTALSSALGYLDIQSPADMALATQLWSSIDAAKVGSEQISRVLRVMSPLARAMRSVQASRYLSAVQQSKSSSAAFRPSLGKTVARISPEDLFSKHFSFIRDQGLYSYVVPALKGHSATPAIVQSASPVPPQVLELLWMDSRAGVSNASTLLKYIASHDNSARAELRRLVLGDASWSLSFATTSGVLSTVGRDFWLELSSGNGEGNTPAWLAHLLDFVFTAVHTDQHVVEDLESIMRDILSIPAVHGLIAGRVQEILAANKFHPSSAGLTLLTKLAEGRPDKESPIIRAAGDAMLKWMIKTVAGPLALTVSDLATLKCFVALMENCADRHLSGYFAEPILTAVVQDRMQEASAVAVATSLCRVADLKASVIRQHLQLLFDSANWKALARSQNTDDNRSGIVALVKALFIASPYIACQAAFIEPLVSVYGGTISKADTDILDIFQLFERQTKTSAASILSCWRMSGTTGRSSTPNALEAVKSLDSQQVFASCILSERKDGSYRHPVTLSADFNALDSKFLLAIFGSCLHTPSISGLDWVEILRSGILGVLMVTLSSKSAAMRGLASRMLAATLVKVEAVPFHEQASLLRVIRLARHAVEMDETMTPERLPFITTLFLSHALRAIAEPSSFLFPLISRFLLQRPTFDVRDVPMLYGMLYAAGQAGRRERRWMARFVRDAVRGESDWRIIQRRHTFALLSSISDSTKDVNFQHTALQAVQAITFVPSAAVILTEKEGLVRWLEQKASGELAGEDRHLVIAILESVIVSLHQRDRARKAAANGDAAKQNHLPSKWTRWAEGLAPLLAGLSAEADLATLDHIAKLATRLSRAAPSQELASCIGAVRLRLQSLEERGDADDPSAVCASLLRCGMDIDPLECNSLHQLSADLRWLASRAARANDEAGKWAAAHRIA